jgi:hypothetical protein
VPGIASLVFGIVLAIGTVAFWGSVGVLLWGS